MPSPVHQGKPSLERANDSYLTINFAEVKDISSLDQFPTSTTRIEDTPTPFREALLQRIHENESVRHLIFSPEFGAAKFRALASLLCVTDRRWLIVLRESDGNTIVDESSFD